MTRIVPSLFIILAVVITFFAGKAIPAQEKYTVQVPDGLAFSEFRGYEDWSVIAISENGGAFAVIRSLVKRSARVGDGHIDRRAGGYFQIGDTRPLVHRPAYPDPGPAGGG